MTATTVSDKALTYEEISAMTGITPRSLRQYRHRGILVRANPGAYACCGTKALFTADSVQALLRHIPSQGWRMEKERDA